MSEPRKLYIIAGERSGDLHASNLIKAIRSKDSNILARGFGGDYMKEAGVDIVVHYDKMAFMGFIEVVKNLNTISKYIKQCKADILDYKPDAVILVDYGGFNMRIAKFAKAQGLRVYYYIPPKVWAWNQSRALKLKSTVDRIFAILPFEKAFFKKFDVNVDYVGNPVLDAIKQHIVNKEFTSKHHLPSDRKIVALLPGSRRQELMRILPVMREVALQHPQYHYVVAAVRTLNEKLYAPVQNVPNVSFVYEETYDLVSAAHAGIVTSGTATLETALFHLPQVVVYRASASTYRIVRMLIRVPFISLVNLIADKLVVREMIQHDCNPQMVGEELVRMMEDNSYRQNMLNEYQNIYNTLDIGSASENTARLMLEDLSRVK